LKIIIDLQGSQSTTNKNRGIGRYSLSITKSIIKNKKEHEVLVVLSSLLPKEAEEIIEELKEILPLKHIHIWQATKKTSFLNSSASERKSLELSRDLFLETLNPDVIYITSLFEGLVDSTTTSISNIRNTDTLIATTLYDLIPLINEKPYLDNSDVKRWYLEKIEHLKRADLLLAISGSSRQEALDYIDAIPEKVANIGTAADSQFQKIEISTQEKESLFKRYGIKHSFLMYTGGIDHRKNIEGLIEAYALLSPKIRDEHQLAIVCSIQNEQKEVLETLVTSLGLELEEVIFTGFISEEDLIALYNLCKAFIFPSWHEGFGLPALEAMWCGAPVIAANTSSLPEVIGLKEALFDPHSTESMSDTIIKVLTDENFRKNLIAHASKQIEKFSWDISAKKAIEAFENARKGNVSPKDSTIKRLRLAYISPLPPERSGISDYSAELLPELHKYYDIDVVVEQTSVEDLWINKHCQILNVTSFKNNLHHYDRVLYHFGNSSFHQHMFQLLIDIPGVVVLHDFFLSGISNYMFHTNYENHSFEDELFYAHGNEPFNTKNSDLIIKYPCNKKVLDYAQGIIVHSQNSVRLAKEWYGKLYGYDWSVIPLLRQPQQKISQKISRKNLNLPKDAFIVASFGLLGQTKLNQKLLDAWIESSLSSDNNTYLIFVGQNSECGYGDKMTETIDNSKYKERIIITGWTDTKIFKDYLSTTDVAVQLRGLSRGETSAAVLDCMNYALPTIVNANGSMADLPQDTVYMLADEFKQKDLTQALEELYTDKKKREALSKNALRVINEEHAPGRCALQYVHAIEAFYSKEIVRKEGFIEFKAKANELEAKANELETKTNELETKSNELETKSNELQQRHNLIINSMSWKITKPYRYLGHKIKWLKGNAKAWVTFAPTSRPRKILKQRLIELKNNLNKHPKLKRNILNILEHIPSIKHRLQRVGGILPPPSPIVGIVFNNASDLSPDAREIHQKLLVNRKKNKGTSN
jgi:glycosyltransferase involved in cell wall biosynthesis